MKIEMKTPFSKQWNSSALIGQVLEPARRYHHIGSGLSW
jgi:hypothetical protein